MAMDQYVGPISPSSGPRLLPGLFRGLLPMPFPFPDAFHGAPALVRTEPLQWRPQLPDEPFIAAGAVATIVEKNPE
jgi:hypothetical protein